MAAALARHSLQREREAEQEQDVQPVHVSIPLPPLHVDTSGNSGQLSTITEGVSPAGRSPTVHTRPNSGDPTVVNTVIHNEYQDNQIQEDQEQAPQEYNASPPRKVPRIVAPSSSSPGFQSKRLGSGFRARLRRHAEKPRRFDIRRLGMHIHFEMSRTPLTSAAPSLKAPDVKQVDWTEETEHRHAGAQDPQTEIRIMPERTTLSSLSTTPMDSSEQVQPPESGHPDPVVDHTPTPHEKHERIRVRRREATLKRQAEMMSICECRSECHCRGDSVPSNAASHGHESSTRSIQIPDHHLQHLLIDSSGSSASQSSSSARRASHLASIGSHLEPDLMNRILDDPSNAVAEGQPPFNDRRLSQASTAYLRSNGSSISLNSRRPASLRRANTTPWSMPRHSAESVRPDIRQILQNPNIPDPARDTVSEPPASPHQSEGGDQNEVRDPSASSTTQEGELPNGVAEFTA
ncbi:MAG: hypothetical protein Q9218_005046 [Villophora microphyllina]